MATDKKREAALRLKIPNALKHFQQLIIDAEACAKAYGKKTLFGGDKFSVKLEVFKKTVNVCVHATRKDGFIDHDALRSDVLLVLNGFMKDLEGTYSSWPLAFEFWRAFLSEELGDQISSQVVDASRSFPEELSPSRLMQNPVNDPTIHLS